MLQVWRGCVGPCGVDPYVAGVEGVMEDTNLAAIGWCYYRRSQGQVPLSLSVLNIFDLLFGPPPASLVLPSA